MDITTNMKKQKAWDYAICITDLPTLSNNKTVVCDIDLTNNIALISLPALGAINLKQKLRHFISFVIQYMYSNGSDNNLLNSQHFKLTKFTTVTPNEEDKNKNHPIRTTEENN